MEVFDIVFWGIDLSVVDIFVAGKLSHSAGGGWVFSRNINWATVFLGRMGANLMDHL